MASLVVPARGHSAHHGLNLECLSTNVSFFYTIVSSTLVRGATEMETPSARQDVGRGEMNVAIRS